MSGLVLLVTGGVISGLGKGVISASLAHLCSFSGSVTMMKIDPYLNLNAGWLSPYEHGEVFVLEDGAETDVDLGTYERMVPRLSGPLKAHNAVTYGQLLQEVLHQAAHGGFGGSTVQYTHVEELLLQRIQAMVDLHDYVVVELGGNVYDPEAERILTALGRATFPILHVHVTLVIEGMSGEAKKAPAQTSIKHAHSFVPIQVVLLRANDAELLTSEVVNAIQHKLPSMVVCAVPKVDDVYDMPVVLQQLLATNFQPERLSWHLLQKHGTWVERWRSQLSARMLERSPPFTPTMTLRIGMVAKYLSATDAYKSLVEAVHHAARWLQMNIEWQVLDAESTITELDVLGCQGVLLPGGFATRGFEGKVQAVRLAKRTLRPLLGICLGMQAMVVESVRSVTGDETYTSAEMEPLARQPVQPLKNRLDESEVFHVGVDDVLMQDMSFDSIGREVYVDTVEVKERFRNAYGVTDWARTMLMEDGWMVAESADETLAWMERRDPMWMVGVQFHPEFRSSRWHPHPLFVRWLEACVCV